MKRLLLVFALLLIASPSSIFARTYRLFGTTEADLTIVDDFLGELEEKDLKITVSEMVITHKDEFDWVYGYADESRDIYIRYIIWADHSKESLTLQVPADYQYADAALAVLIGTVTGAETPEAEKYLEEVREAAKGDYAALEVEKYTLSYHDILGQSIMLEVSRPVNGPPTEAAETEGIIPDESTTSAESVLEEMNRRESALKRIVTKRTEEYWNAELKKFTVYWNEDLSIRSARADYQWNTKNSVERTKTMLEMYSDDLAATIANDYTDAEISELYIFWVVPSIHETEVSAKYKYTFELGKAYRESSTGKIY